MCIYYRDPLFKANAINAWCSIMGPENRYLVRVHLNQTSGVFSSLVGSKLEINDNSTAFGMLERHMVGSCFENWTREIQHSS